MDVKTRPSKPVAATGDRQFKGFSVVHDPLAGTRRYIELLRAGKREEARQLAAEEARNDREWAIQIMLRADEEALRAANDAPAPPRAAASKKRRSR